MLNEHELETIRAVLKQFTNDNYAMLSKYNVVVNGVSVTAGMLVSLCEKIKKEKYKLSDVRQEST